MIMLDFKMQGVKVIIIDYIVLCRNHMFHILIYIEDRLAIHRITENSHKMTILTSYAGAELLSIPKNVYTAADLKNW